MQSVNSEVDQTLGLTQNVPMLLREITFYVQFHVIHNPMYNILLGRPFDVLLESIVHNYSSSKNCPNVWPFCNVWVITQW